MNRKVAILVKRFPKLSETFIFGEIAALVDSGLDIRIISMHRPNESLLQPNAMRFADRVTYLDPDSGFRPMVAFIWALLRNLREAPNIIGHLRRSGLSMAQLAALIDACNGLNIGHLHAHYISEPALLADLASRLRGSSFSVSAHAKDIYLTNPDSIRERLKKAEFVSTCTAHNHRYLSGLSHRDRAKIRLSYHGIDSDQFCPATTPAPDKTPLVIAVGRFKEKKGFDLLIAACASLIEAGMPLRCEIIGYGDQQQRLQQLITAKGLDAHVRLKAPVNHAELVGIMHNASLCVLPCRQTPNGDRDGIPNALLEAMSCGVPVISTSISGIPEVILSGANGILVEPEDPQALANAIHIVLSDAKLRKKLADGGRRTVRDNFNWRTNTAELGEMLGTIVSNTACSEHA